jgi:hypothetical protein
VVRTARGVVSDSDGVLLYLYNEDFAEMLRACEKWPRTSQAVACGCRTTANPGRRARQFMEEMHQTSGNTRTTVEALIEIGVQRGSPNTL